MPSNQLTIRWAPPAILQLGFNVTTLLYNFTLPNVTTWLPNVTQSKEVALIVSQATFQIISLSLSIRSHSNEDDVALFSLNGLSHTQFVPRRSLMIEMSKFPTEIASLRVELDAPPYYPRLLCLFSSLCPRSEHDFGL